MWACMQALNDLRMTSLESGAGLHASLCLCGLLAALMSPSRQAFSTCAGMLFRCSAHQIQISLRCSAKVTQDPVLLQATNLDSACAEEADYCFILSFELCVCLVRTRLQPNAKCHSLSQSAQKIALDALVTRLHSPLMKTKPGRQGGFYVARWVSARSELLGTAAY